MTFVAAGLLLLGREVRAQVVSPATRGAIEGTVSDSATGAPRQSVSVLLDGMGRGALTGRDDPAVVARCVEAGCKTVLLKPVPARDLLRMCKEWLA